MPPSVPRDSRSSFRETALASGIVERAQLAAAEQQASAALPADAADTAVWDAEVAGRLVSAGHLTPFQARELLAGRRRFRLGQYTVLDEIGRGGMGQVFKAEHAFMGRVVAVKVLPGSKATPESEAAFCREMRILGRLDHENLVRAFDAGYDAMVYYLVTEFVPGHDLKRHIRLHGQLDEASAASVFGQVARGLAYAHEQGVVHRDVKPGNILVLEDGRVKVLDMGLAGSTLEKEAMRLGRVVGTMDYIAPEQIRQPDAVGPAADIYALGCTLYFALTGQVPFPGGSRKEKMQRHLTEPPAPITSLAPHVSAQMCRVVESMMQKSPADRIGTAAEVIERLRRWVPDHHVPLRRQPQTSRRDGPPRPGERSTDSASTSAASPSQGSSSLQSSLDSLQEAADAGLDSGGKFGDAALGNLRRTASSKWARDVAAAAVRILPASLAVGIGFGWVISLIRGLSPARFDILLAPVTPATFGLAAFLVMLVTQAAAMRATRQRP